MSITMDVVLPVQIEPIPGQIGQVVVLDLNGSIVVVQDNDETTTNNNIDETTNTISHHDIQILYQMLIECGSIINESISSSVQQDVSLFRRFTVNYPTMRYIVTMDTSFIYVVKATSKNIS